MRPYTVIVDGRLVGYYHTQHQALDAGRRVQQDLLSRNLIDRWPLLQVYYETDYTSQLICED